MSRFALLFALLFAVLRVAAAQTHPPAHAPSHAQSEAILDYHSDITLQPDGSMRVTETIKVNSRGIQIRHGIYRDFPTEYKDQLGNRYVVSFNVLGATRDGAPEVYRLETLGNGTRVYLGQPGYFLTTGEHTYTIDYLTDRQLGFFKDHDELFWNVTGNGWAFNILHASATVHLPENIPPDKVQLSGFTGSQGATARNLDVTSNDDGTFSFASNLLLPPHSGLSILLSWPKGFISEPTPAEKRKILLDNNPDLIFVLGGAALLLLYYFIVWLAVGRDPEHGVIMPLYEPPANLSPAAMRYLVRMGYDNKVFAASILSMAVKGYLTIRQQAGSYTLYLTKNAKPAFSQDERDIAEKLFTGRDELWLHNENHVMIRAAISSQKALLKNAEETIYFFTNSCYMIPAVMITVASLIGILYAHPGPMTPAALFICFWLTIWSLAITALLMSVTQNWKAAFAGEHFSFLLAGKALFTTLFAVPFLAGEAFGIFVLAKSTSPLAAAFLIGSVFVHYLFHNLLKAPTSAGGQLLDQIAGFKLFLGAVDADRMNRVMPPDQTPQTFEKFLPYALALDVEQHWAEKFSGVLGIASNGPNGQSNFSPAWYSGAGWGAAGFASSMSSSLTGAISSSSSAPGSSGGGGGGSGGGGGGGGGGGW